MQSPNALLELNVLNTQLHYGEETGSPCQKQIVSLQLITILWMCAEAAIALFAALHAHSVALLGFGADSGIELVSAFVVFLRFKKVSHVNEKGAARITGLLLYTLAACIPRQLDSGIYESRFPTATKLFRHSAIDRSSDRDALALCSKENASCENQQRRVEGRCCTEFTVRLFGVDCLGRFGFECDVQNLMGRSVSGAVAPSDNRARGPGRHEGEIL